MTTPTSCKFHNITPSMSFSPSIIPKIKIEQKKITIIHPVHSFSLFYITHINIIGSSLLYISSPSSLKTCLMLPLVVPPALALSFSFSFSYLVTFKHTHTHTHRERHGGALACNQNQSYINSI